MGTVTLIPEARAWILRDGWGLYALSASCTHLGCTLGEGGPGFSCPCHGSLFDAQGQVFRGPAAKPLEALELSVAPDGQLLLNASQPVPRNQRLAVT